MSIYLESFWSYLQRNLNKEGIVDFSSFTRSILINGHINLISTIEVDAVNKLSSQLSKIGNIVNQIARVVQLTCVYQFELKAVLR